MSFSLETKKSNTDEWYTRAEDVELIVPFIEKRGYHKILCPFDRYNSEFVKVLQNRGFDVTHSHIEDGQDFFDINDLEKYDAVVSNPPFSKKEAILKKLFDTSTPFAMIMNLGRLFDSKVRWNLFRNNDFELIIPLGRMQFFNDETCNKPPNFQSVYVCRGMASKQIEFVDKTHTIKS